VLFAPKNKKTSCPYAKIKKIKKGDGRKNPILSLYENENLKKGVRKKKCLYAKMKKIKKGDRRKNNILSLYENENLKKGDKQK
jgi:hypothetical protein